MKLRSRLKHAAAGLLGALISRNNDIGGAWALGLLYRDVGTPPHTLELDLLRGTARPPTESATLVAKRYAHFVKVAVEKQKVAWDEITHALVTLQFNAQVPDPDFYYPCLGDPVIGTVTLHTAAGKGATLNATARCFPSVPDAHAGNAEGPLISHQH